MPSASKISSNKSPRLGRLPTASVVVLASLLAAGCPDSSYNDYYYSNECATFTEDGYCREYKRNAQPVYMSYEKLRSAIEVESPRPPDRIGRLYLYDKYVFLNELNEGIHIIDNSNQTSPVNVAFIRIPGNTDIAIRDNFLYADSYLDLVTLALDVDAPQNVSIIGREQDIFPYDEYQNIPQNISFSDATIERELGVVISYRLNGS